MRADAVRDGAKRLGVSWGEAGEGGGKTMNFSDLPRLKGQVHSGRDRRPWECDKCPTCLAHTHHLKEHKCDKLIALLYQKTLKTKRKCRVLEGGIK